MFKKGEKVIDSGVRAHRHVSGQHYYGTDPTMAQWAENNTVLTVTSNGSGSHVSVGRDGETCVYHPSELRYATPAELVASEAPAQPEPTLKRGSIIKLKDGNIGFVLRPTQDSDGDYRASFLDIDRITYFKPEDIAEVVGSIEADGSFLPTPDADPDPCPTWRNLNVGDIIRVSPTNPRYVAWMDKRAIVAGIDASDSHRRLCVKDKSNTNSSAWVRGDVGDFEIIVRAGL